ncbi:PAP2-like phosphatidic acid phosphatase [Ordospora colligata]|uniref:PAP2-like phosphatidic acid phosphatase n=1 Tax=Ordospora colligata OC4 TaxID=1354746 RepID=A0A0B2ULA5_9MICR|nr:PAP2-like phosphatidic acid phosphatase [Ordospora colligata OC4]KHN69735.1 PAP2-like phosphatidic acid phosphatase [Ordospora colligata OC4]TBU15538.1 PAP2-like phosphatidic acid phosphatase [Ordospora colligata]TBU15701.1 PAP2-like phosphatidic acid phosphatase [Ordospora colligata]TBU18656.1 PAP2-like phosphatidic acid phosphatase [Ordospora colligata]
MQDCKNMGGVIFKNAVSELVAVFVIDVAQAILSYVVGPYERVFDEYDVSISKPHAINETISYVEVIGLAIVVPLICLYVVLHSNPSRSSKMYFYVIFMLSCLTTFAATEAMKNVFGRLRPDFLSRCMPVNGVCTGLQPIVTEGRRSFPSGHMSMVVCGASFFMFFTWREFKLHLRNRIWRFVALAVVWLLLFIGSMAIGMSRVTDNRHFVSDVIGGAVIGGLSAAVGFRYLNRSIELQKNKSTRVRARAADV